MKLHKTIAVVLLVLVMVSLMGTIGLAEEKVIKVFMDIGGMGTAQSGAVELFNKTYKGQYRVEPLESPGKACASNCSPSSWLRRELGTWFRSMLPGVRRPSHT